VDATSDIAADRFSASYSGFNVLVRPQSEQYREPCANTLAEQVSIPLLSSFEMANISQAAVVQVVQNSSYAALFKQAGVPGRSR
jgi:cytochrome c peroxidase